MSSSSVTPDDSLRIETRGGARVITLWRTAKKNALARSTVEALAQAIDEAGADPSVRGIVIAAEGDVFMAGGDLSEFAAILDDEDAATRVIEMGARLRVIEACAVPVVCAVAGDVYGGGCEFLLLCDAVFVERGVSLSFRHAFMGLSPAWGGASRLLERVGPLQASRLLFTSERVDTEDARRMGLVTDVVERGQAFEAACDFIARVGKNDRDVIADNKRALTAARAVSRKATDAIEAETFTRLWGGPAHRAAMKRRR